MSRSPPIRSFLWASLLTYCLTPTARAESPIFVGVLEDVEPDNDLSSGMVVPHVRLAFEYHDNTWHEFNLEYPARVEWTIVFDGRRIGTLQSRAPKSTAHMLGNTGIETITTPPDKLPDIRAGANRFTYAGYAARTRPLILVSEPHFSDPEGWKPTQLSATEKALAIRNFRTKVTALDHCDPPDQDPPNSIPYSDDQVTFPNIYRSKHGEILVGMKLDFAQSGCDFEEYPSLEDYWFVLNGSSAQYLGSQMAPLDAADLTGTGSSVWIFQTTRNEGGDSYELFYDDFSKNTSFSWAYR
jgi:hypothetical protein